MIEGHKNLSFSLDSFQRFHPCLHGAFDDFQKRSWGFESQNSYLSPPASCAKLYTHIPILSALKRALGSLPDMLLSRAFTMLRWVLDRLSFYSSFIS